MPRVSKITEGHLADTAIALIEDEGPDALTLTSLAAALGIRPPSLYNHVSGIDEVRHLVGIVAMARLGDALASTAIGRTGPDALLALAEAYRDFARSSPEIYDIAFAETAGWDDTFDSRAWRALAPLYAVLSASGLDDAETVHAARMIRSALHGFVTLENAGQFGLPESVDESFDELIGWLAGLLPDDDADAT